ncbi:MAG TPA: hypothetical protein VNA24_23965 [Hyalangium sp.]|nr:hypothetical protein [Hyalangium sp.]
MVTLSLLALLFMSAAPDADTRSSSVEASVGWRVDPALDLKGALARGTDAPVFAAYDGGWCVDIGRWAEPDKPTRWIWAWCPSSTEPATAPRSCQTLEAIKLELATCGQGNLERLLRLRSTLERHRPKWDDAIAPLQRRVERGPLQAEQLGCATSVTSPDGRVRSWTVQTAVRREGHYTADNAERGEAYLQWLTPQGDVEVVPDGAWEDLALDAVIDGIFPMPGLPNEYLVTGYKYRGFSLLRFAEILSLAGEHPRLARARFLVGTQKEDVLLISGGYPETGKPRHSPVYNHWIRLKGRQLWIEPIPGESCCSPQTKPFVLAEWTGAVFKTSQGSWAKLLTLRELYTP